MTKPWERDWSQVTDEDLRQKMVEKEARRAEEVEKGEAIREDIGQRFVTGAKEAAVDVPISALQSTMMEFGDEAYGAIAAGFKKATGDERSLEELYTEAKQSAQSVISGARDRSPMATFIADVVSPNPAKFFKVLKPAAGAVGGSLTTLAGMTETTEEFQEGIPATTAMALGMKGVGALGKKTIGEPRATESRFLGLDKGPSGLKRGAAIQWEEEVKGSLDRLRAKGFFNKGKSSFNANLNKWRGTGKGLDKFKQSDIKDISKKSKEALERSSKHIEKKLQKQSPEIFPEEMVSGEVEIGKEYKITPNLEVETIPIKKAYEPISKKGILTDDDLLQYDDNRIIEIENSIVNKFGKEEAEGVKTAVQESLDNLKHGREAFTILDLHKEKQRLYNDLAGEFKKVNLKDSEKEAKKQLARMYKDMVNEMSGDETVVKANELMEDVFRFQDAVEEKIKRRFLESPLAQGKGMAYGGPMFRVERAMETIVDPTRPYRAQAGRALEESPNLMKGIESVGLAPTRYLMRPEDQGREPQSVNLAEDLVRTPLPRDVDRIIQNKEMVLAKTAQQAPELFDNVKDIIENSPEQLHDVLPALIQAAPHLFEYDKYNRVDGMIINDADKQRARSDTMKRDDLSNTEKVMIINQLNKTGQFDDY